jgi:hypothetical protein
MRFDDIDIGIIHYLHDNPHQTTSEVAKKIFECKTSRELLKQDSLIRHRLKNMVKKHVVMCSPTTPKTYSTNPECVFCGAGMLNINVDDGKKIEIDFGKFLVVTNGDDYLYINRVAKDEKKEDNIEIKNPPDA